MADAELIGRDWLHPPYAAFVSTGAARATQMLEILRHAAGQDQTPITVAPGLRSSVEDRWREAARAAGKDADLDALRALDPDLVKRESWLLGSQLRQMVWLATRCGPSLSPATTGPCQSGKTTGRSGSSCGRRRMSRS